MPIRKEDRVRVVRGIKGKRGSTDKLEGKVTHVYRKKFVIYIDRNTKDNKPSGPVQVPIDPSNVEIVALKMDRNRQQKIDAKVKSLNTNRARRGLPPVTAEVN